MDTVLDRLRAELSGRYSVEEEVGRGGMALVYSARDVRHGRRVAIKVLRQDTGSATAADRFLREIQTVAQLHHPHILPLHDSGVAGDHFFYVMPFVVGESLRQRLERAGRLSVEEAVQIAREVADALAFAHDQGIIHRDIKPENILLSAGHATVADFGIARAINEAGFTAADVSTSVVNMSGITMTATGVAVGTPLYMSPEQASAGTVLDGRTDQYSLGCVVYEMLTGKPPFTGHSALAILSRHTSDPAPSAGTERPDLPPGLDQAIGRALSKAPADRWPTTRDFANAIELSIRVPTQELAASERRARRWTQAALATGLIGALAFGVYRFGPGAKPAGAAAVPVVGVLPFEYSGDTAFSYLADGLSEGVTSGLYRVPGLRTAAPGRTARYRGAAVDPQQAGRDLGLTMVVTARVQVADGRIRVSPQIVRVADGVLVWAGESFDGIVQAGGRTTDLFAIQDSMNIKVVRAVLPRLTAAQRSLASRGARTQNPEAWRLYLEARRLTYNGDSVSVFRAKVLLDSALRLDSTFSDAWTVSAQAEDNVAHYSNRPPEDFKVAMRRALNRAVLYDSGSGYALAQRGIYKVLNDWDWDQALIDMKKARELEPGSIDVESTYLGLLSWLGMADSVKQRTLEIHDTTNVTSWQMVAFAYMGTLQWDSVVVAAERVEAMAPDIAWNDQVLAWAYLETGQRARADSAAARFMRRTARQSDDIGNIAVYYRRAGDLRGARELRRRLDALRQQTTWSVHSAEAMVRLALGDRNGALVHMDSAVNAREYLVPVMMISGLDPLRNEPRFIAAKQRVWGNRTLPRLFAP